MNPFELARLPIPSDFIRKLTKGTTSIDYLPWAVVVDYMDVCFKPENWDMVVDSVNLFPVGEVTLINGDSVMRYHIVVTVTVTVRYDGITITRSNTGEDYNIEVFKKGNALSDKGVMSATHTALKRACALIGIGRFLYLRDPEEGIPSVTSLIDVTNARLKVWQRLLSIRQNVHRAVADGTLSEEDAIGYLEHLVEIAMFEVAPDPPIDTELDTVERRLVAITSKTGV